MWSHEPGSFTRIIAAIVSPRKTSSETTRSARDASPTVRVFGTAMVSAVAMSCSSAGGDSTAARKMSQCWPFVRNRNRLLANPNLTSHDRDQEIYYYFLIFSY